MRKSVWLIIACVLFLVANIAQAKRWHSMTQAERNQKIVERAVKDMGKNTKLLCGDWVEKIVFDVSKTHYGPVLVSFDGSKYPNINKDKASTNLVCITGDGSFPIEKAQAGWIVWYYNKRDMSSITNQINSKVGVTKANHVKVTSHVMIIKSVSATGIEVIDCNAVGPTTVGTCHISFRKFYDNIMTIKDGKKLYSLYCVL